MSIRPRTDADLPACVAALHTVYEASGYPTRWPTDPEAWLCPAGQLTAWVAEHDGAIVGQVGVLEGTAEPGLAAATGLAVEDLVLVTRLFVSPAARGLGLARALVGTVTAYGAEQNLRVGLDVTEASTDAIALYEGLGWTYCGSERARWQTQNGEYPTIRYYLAPSPRT